MKAWKTTVSVLAIALCFSGSVNAEDKNISRDRLQPSSLANTNKSETSATGKNVSSPAKPSETNLIAPKGKPGIDARSSYQMDFEKNDPELIRFVDYIFTIYDSVGNLKKNTQNYTKYCCNGNAELGPNKNMKDKRLLIVALPTKILELFSAWSDPVDEDFYKRQPAAARARELFQSLLQDANNLVPINDQMERYIRLNLYSVDDFEGMRALHSAYYPLIKKFNTNYLSASRILYENSLQFLEAQLSQSRADDFGFLKAYILTHNAWFESQLNPDNKSKMISLIKDAYRASLEFRAATDKIPFPGEKAYKMLNAAQSMYTWCVLSSNICLMSAPN